MVETQYFCLRRNNYQSSIPSAFENLRDDEDFVDVTLACDGKSLKAHRVVLSACSPYFRELLKSTPCKHPVIVLQNVAFTDLHALVDFIYYGEVNVHQRNLSSFLKTAEVLRVFGLTQHEDAQGPLIQSITRTAAPAASSPRTPLQPAHTPHTTNYNEKLEEAPHPIMRRIPLPPRRMFHSADHSPDFTKRVRHDNNNDQLQDHDFFKNSTMVNSTCAHNEQGNENGISNSSSSPSPRLIDEVKNEPLDMICPFNPDIDRSADDTPSHYHRPLGDGPPSRTSSAEADDCTPLPLLPSPFISPDLKLFQTSHNHSYSMALTDNSAMVGLPSPLVPDGMASTSQVDPLGAVHRYEVCGKLLSSRLTLKAHTEQQHLQPLHSARCSLCHKVFRTLNSLKNQQPQHTPAAVPAPAPLAALAKPHNRSTGIDAKLAPPSHAIDVYKISLKFKLLPSNRTCTFYV